MNAKYAKQNLSMPELMSALGYSPVRTKTTGKGTTYWYTSPFRKEKDASFQLTPGNDVAWVWNDHGDHASGHIIDFVMRHEGCDLSQALKYLRKYFPEPLFRTRPQSPKRAGEGTPNHTSLFSFTSKPDSQKRVKSSVNTNPERDLTLVDVKPLQSPFIFSYLEGRGIPPKLAKRYLVLIHYRNKQKPSEKPYFGFGVKNIHGGYEIRSATDSPKGIFKSAVGGKAVTLIKGRQPSRGEVSVFEGFIDFLSLITFFYKENGVEHLNGDALILNGLEMYEHSGKAELIKQNYSRINLFLDNNTAGQNKTEIIKHDFGEKIIDYSPAFLPHIDLNDALCADAQINFSSTQPTLEP